MQERFPVRHLSLLAQLKPSITVGDYFFCHAGVRPGIPLEQQRQQDLLWIRDPFLESRVDFGKVVVHGHSATEQPDFRANRINIDTGAYATGRLTCLVLEGSRPSYLVYVSYALSSRASRLKIACRVGIAHRTRPILHLPSGPEAPYKGRMWR